MLVGLFGFYSRWIPWFFENKIGPWQQILKMKPPVHTPVEEEAAKLEANWTPIASQLLEEMKEAIISGPVLKRPDWNRPFYVKTDWSSYAKGGALCQPNFQKNFQEYLQKKRTAEKNPRFDPNNWKKDGFPSAKATSLFNGILADAPNAPSQQHLVAKFVYENNTKSDLSVERKIGRIRKQAHLNPSEEDQDDGGGAPVALPFWVVRDNQDHEDSRSFAASAYSPGISSYQFDAQGTTSALWYPISSELPHVVIPVGRKAEATVEGLLDTGGACTMGDLVYWREVAARCPHLIAQFEELSDH
jgi:RNase H-like domain found in reverse transcriptase